jgi:hypothetical protein
MVKTHGNFALTQRRKEKKKGAKEEKRDWLQERSFCALVFPFAPLR